MTDPNAKYWRPHEEFGQLCPPIKTCAKAILFIDFETTITVSNAWYLSRVMLSPKLLDDEIMLQIFGSEKYIRHLRRFWCELNKIPGLEVQILSSGIEKFIKAIFKKLDLDPPPAKFVGDKTLKRKGFDKPAYVRHEISQSNPQYVFFVDDKESEREKMLHGVKEAIVFCSDIYAGITEDVAEEILEMIKSRLN